MIYKYIAGENEAPSLASFFTNICGWSGEPTLSSYSRQCDCRIFVMQPRRATILLMRLGTLHVIVTGLYHSGRPFLWPFQTPIKEGGLNQLNHLAIVSTSQ